MPVADSDAHVVEPNDLWRRHLPPQWQERAPRVVTPGDRGRRTVEASATLALVAAHAGLDPAAVLATVDGGRVGFRHLEVDGQTVWEGIPDEVWSRGLARTLQHHPASALAGFDAASHARALRAMGIDRVHLYPTVGLWLFAIEGMEPSFAAALVRAYNDWLRDFCATDPLFRPVAAIARHDPAEMVAELQRVAGWGWRAVTLRPNPFSNRTLAAPEYETFWSECERLGVAIAVHEGTHGRLPTTGRDRFRTRFGRHACSHPMEQMMAMLALIEGGVLERHPRLRVAFLEAGAGWLPYWLARLDAEYRELGWEVADRVCLKPSDYFRRQCFVTCNPGEPGLEDVIHLLGEGRLLYGSDFPHMDHDPEVASAITRLSERLSTGTAAKILWDNPNAFYGEL